MNDFQSTQVQPNGNTLPASGDQQPNGVIGMQVSTPNRDNRRPAEANTGGTPNSKRGRPQRNGGQLKSPPQLDTEIISIPEEEPRTHSGDDNSIDREQLSLQSQEPSIDGSINTAPGRIVLTDNGFTFVNTRNSPRRKKSGASDLDRSGRANGGRGGSGRGLGSGIHTGNERRYRRALHPLVTGELRNTSGPPEADETTNENTTKATPPAKSSPNGVYRGGYYQALADDGDDTNQQNENESVPTDDYASQPGNLNGVAIQKARHIPTSLQEALSLLSAYKILPKGADADPAGGHLHHD